MFEEESTNVSHSEDVSKPTHVDESQPKAEDESVNMFASVWLKVEVDDESNSDVDNAPDFRYRQQKPKHKKKLHRPKTPFKCDECDYTTIYKNCLKLHVMGHQNLKPHACDTCDYTTKYRTALQRHIFIQHQLKSDQTGATWPVQKCSECDYETYFKWNLNAHMRKHKTDKQYQCQMCPYATSYRYNYIKHAKVHNKQTVQFRCDKCPFVTKYSGHIHRHLSQIHNEVTGKANMCDLCDFSTITRWRLNVHKQRSRQDTTIRCDHCDFETFYKCESKKHKYVHYAEIYGNSVFNAYKMIDGDTVDPKTKSDSVDCGTQKECATVSNPLAKSTDDIDSFTAISLTNENILTSTHFLDNLNTSQPTNFKVTHDFSPKLPDFAIDHTASLNMSHNAQSQNNSVVNPSDFAFHNDNSNSSEDCFAKESSHKSNKTHERSNNYMVDPKCEVDWNSIQVLESNNKERPFQCAKCKYTSKFKASVQRHFQRHHTSLERPYKCCNCDFSTKTKDQISLHNKRSKSDTRLACAVCEFSTLFKCQFVVHQKCHYAHKCPACDYKCKHKYEIDKHYSTMHVGDGLKCRFCDFRSVRKQSLLCHETIHTGNKPFRCRHCHYTSVRKSLLDNHLKRYHNEVRKDFRVVSENKIQSLKVSIDMVPDGLENPFAPSVAQ